MEKFEYFLTAIALLLILEGIGPFLSPKNWRKMLYLFLVVVAPGNLSKGEVEFYGHIKIRA